MSSYPKVASASSAKHSYTDYFSQKTKRALQITALACGLILLTLAICAFMHVRGFESIGTGGAAALLGTSILFFAIPFVLKYCKKQSLLPDFPTYKVLIDNCPFGLSIDQAQLVDISGEITIHTGEKQSQSSSASLPPQRFKFPKTPRHARASALTKMASYTREQYKKFYKNDGFFFLLSIELATPEAKITCQWDYLNPPRYNSQQLQRSEPKKTPAKRRSGAYHGGD